MGIIGGAFGYHILRKITANRKPGSRGVDTYGNKSKLDVLHGPRFWREIQNKVIVDFGCGSGEQAIEMVERGAERVVGVDIREELLRNAQERTRKAGLDDCCTFTTHTSECADVIVSTDSFEHFEDPSAILRVMYGVLKPSGCIIAAFGPTWYHPFGGHLFSVFPWAHVIFTESALIRWRSDFKTDGATCFAEVEGGLNQLTVRRFESIVKKSPFRFVEFETVPIRKLKFMANRLTREVTTSVVRCKLVPRR